MTPIGGVIVPADAFGATELVEYVRRLESLGYDSVWIPDMFGREIYVTCAHLLANTTTINVASGIAHVYGRDAIASAQAARTLSELSGGRFIHGVGISHPPAAELRGLSWEPPIAKMRTYLIEMRAAMSGDLLHTLAAHPLSDMNLNGFNLLQEYAFGLFAPEIIDGPVILKVPGSSGNPPNGDLSYYRNRFAIPTLAHPVQHLHHLPPAIMDDELVVARRSDGRSNKE